MQTIAVIPLPWIGAVQFGSMQKVSSYIFCENNNKVKKEFLLINIDQFTKSYILFC